MNTADNPSLIFSCTFAKQERLASKKEIEALFKSGKSLFCFPFKIYYLLSDQQYLASKQVLITIPKRLFKKAVDRNKLKRYFREAYRKHKNTLSLPLSNKQLHIAFLYVHSEIATSGEIEKKTIIALGKIAREIKLL